MSERQAHYQAGERAADLAQLLVDDPHLYELLERARDAYNNLAAYMAAKCADAGQAIPAEWLGLMVDAEKRRAGRAQDGRSAEGEG